MTNRLLAICFDFGDTLADEATEIKDETETTQSAELIPGAEELVRTLKAEGFTLALVADGRPDTYDNVLKQHQIHHLFDAFAVSELVGVEKPDPAMFRKALHDLHIAEADYGRTMMVGNRLDRDIGGANELGMVSVWLDWSARYEKTIQHRSEQPDYTIKLPLELLEIISSIEQKTV